MNQYRKYLFVFAAVLLCTDFLAGCEKVNGTTGSGEAKEAVYTKITAKQAKDMMDNGNPYILLDVRTKEEFREKRIPGAILIPNTEIRDRAEKELPDKDAVIFVYCRSGGRSAGAAHELVAMGYTRVYDIGGIMNWPYDTVRGEGGYQ